MADFDHSGPAAPASPASADLLPDGLTLARGQIADGLPMLAERTLLGIVAALEERGAQRDALDEARLLLGEALWRQHRPRAAGAVVSEIGAAEVRRRPLARLIEAESLATSGDAERATELMERLVADVGVEELWELRAGVRGRLSWPEPDALTRVEAEASALGERADRPEAVVAEASRRAGLARARLQSARMALEAGEDEIADDELTLALRLDPGVATEALELVEPRMRRPATRRLVLYGDLLAALGRGADAEAVYERAAAVEQD